MFPTITAKLDTMRKEQDFCILTDDQDNIVIQSDKRFGRFNFRTGNGYLSTKGNTSLHLHPSLGGKRFTFPPEFVAECLRLAAPQDSTVSLGGGVVIANTTITTVRSGE